MQENNFEKKVQSLMDELKFKPSEDVWPAIKERIRQKKRRRFIFFLLPLLCALFVTGYFFYENNNKPVANNSTLQTPQNNPRENEGLSDPASIQLSTENMNGDNVMNDITNPVSSEQNINKPLPNQNDNVIAQHQKNFQTPVETSGLINFQQELILTDDDPLIDKTEEKQNISSGIVDEELMETKINQLISPETVSPYNQPVQVLDQLIIPNPESSLKKNVLDAVMIQTGLNLKNEIVKNTSSKWKLGFHITAGSSKTVSKSALPGMQEQNALMDFNNAPNLGGSYAGRPIYIRPPQKANAGLSVEAGIHIQKQFSARSSVMVGLQYFYVNDRLLAGTQYNNTNQLQFASSSSARRYFSGNDAWYSNRYHFIELPIQYGYLLNKKSDVPVRLHAGLIVSQLISTNGVIYDPALTGIYFHERKQFNNTGLSLSSGLSFSFNQNKKLKWSVGPQVRAGLTSLRKPTYDLNKYLLSGGLQFKLIID